MSADSYPRYFVTNIIKLLHRQQLLSCTVTNCRDAPRCGRLIPVYYSLSSDASRCVPIVILHIF